MLMHGPANVRAVLPELTVQLACVALCFRPPPPPPSRLSRGVPAAPTPAREAPDNLRCIFELYAHYRDLSTVACAATDEAATFAALLDEMDRLQADSIAQVELPPGFLPGLDGGLGPAADRPLGPGHPNPATPTGVAFGASAELLRPGSGAGSGLIGSGSIGSGSMPGTPSSSASRPAGTTVSVPGTPSSAARPRGAATVDDLGAWEAHLTWEAWEHAALGFFTR